jgi:serine/threonine protein phosphatase PrpC
LVSHYFTDRLPDRVFANPKWKVDPSAAIAEEVDRLERSLLAGACASRATVLPAAPPRPPTPGARAARADASIDTEFSGSTCVLGVIRDNKLIVNNIGDSRIILAKRTAAGKLEAVPVSSDHKPDRPDEQKRIEACGGRVFAVEYDDGVDGPPRVWLGHMDIPGLAMARSLGDTVAHTAGVISEPETHHMEVLAEHKVLVMASDGLWEFMSNQEVIDMITGVKEPKKAVDLLVQEAGERWMREEQVIDDTTVIVAYM